MKLLLSLLVSVFAVIGFNASATNYKFVAADDSEHTEMCVLAGTNNHRGLRFKIHLSNYSKRDIANTLYCNGLVLSNFAYKYGAEDVYKDMERFTLPWVKQRQGTVTIQDIALTPKAYDDKEVVILVSAK